MTSLSPSPLGRLWQKLRFRFYACAVARELNFYADMNDHGLDLLEDRVIALEEIIAAGDQEEAAELRERLRAELLAADALYAGAETTFRRRRQAWAGDRVIITSREAAARRRGER